MLCVHDPLTTTGKVETCFQDFLTRNSASFTSYSLIFNTILNKCFLVNACTSIS